MTIRRGTYGLYGDYCIHSSIPYWLPESSMVRGFGDVGFPKILGVPLWGSG